MLPALVLIAASFAAAEGPVASMSVAVLKERVLGATEENERGRALDQIAQTAPSSAQDVAALFDLFTRFPDPRLRSKMMQSLQRIQPGSPQLEPLFVIYLTQEEPEAQLFGINGAFRLRSRQSLPYVRKIAERPFKAASAASVNALTERNEWWTQFEALSALAQWEGEKALPLLQKKAVESPAVARLLGQFFWTRTLPDIARWSRSTKSEDVERAVEASGAAIEPAEARATRATMLEILRDPKTDHEVRHRLALKVGACANEEETTALIREHDAAADDTTRMLWTAAVFAAHNPAAVPLLARYARQSPDDGIRAGARTLLVDQVGEEKAAEMLKAEKTIKKQ